MLNLSSCTITFNPSSAYVRLIGVIDCLAAAFLFQSGLPVVIKIIGLLYLIVHFVRTVQQPHPQQKYNVLTFQNKQWFLKHKTGREDLFSRHRFLLDVGLFFLLELSSDNSRKLLVLFHDQISNDHYRFLRILENIQ